MTCTCVSTIMAELLFVVPLGMSTRAAAPARNRRRYIRNRRRLYQTICSRDVLAHNSAASRLRHRLDHFAPLLQVISPMGGMRGVARPEKLVLAPQPHPPHDLPF